MNTFILSDLVTKELETINCEEELLDIVTHLCWEKMKWTPLLAIHEGHIFIHSETWEPDFMSLEGVEEWKQIGIDIEKESDYDFLHKLKKHLNIDIQELKE